MFNPCLRPYIHEKRTITSSSHVLSTIFSNQEINLYQCKHQVCVSSVWLTLGLEYGLTQSSHTWKKKNHWRYIMQFPQILFLFFSSVLLPSLLSEHRSITIMWPDKHISWLEWESSSALEVWFAATHKTILCPSHLQHACHRLNEQWPSSCFAWGH